MSEGSGQRGEYVQKVLEETSEYVASLLAEIERLRASTNELEDQFEDVFVRAQQLAQQNTNLAGLYIASYQLHESLDRTAILAAIKETIANFIGCEEIAIFEMRAGGGGAVEMIDSMGVTDQTEVLVEVGAGPIGEAVASGQPYFAPQNGEMHSGRLTACVPMKVEARVSGAIALFGLLQQKSVLLEADRELLLLLGLHAAMALYCIELHEERVIRTAHE